MVCKSKWMLAAFAFAGFALIALPAAGQKDVVVTNGPAQPVPTAAQGTTTVAGTVNVGNTPNMNVVNTPNMNVVNTPSVNVANTPAVSITGTASVTNALDPQGNPIPLAVSEAFQPYEDTCTISFSGNGAGFCLFHTPPPGKRLVVQQFDAASGFVPFGLESGCKPLVIGLNVTHSGTPHFFPATFMGTQTETNRDFYATHQETRLYGTAGDAPQCTVNLTCFSQASYSCQLSGFLAP